MGGRESKPLSLTYEEAAKRVSEAELSRLKLAFKKTATNGNFISCHTFGRYVLGETVPPKLSQQIFAACGGSSYRGIPFRDLLCSLVLLTKGTQEEKIRFIFCLYSNEGSSAVVRHEFLRQLEVTEGKEQSHLIVAQCMGQSDRVDYAAFRTWLQRNPTATCFTRWLLTPPAVAPRDAGLTFYQTLSGVTHLEEGEILEMEKCYWALKGGSNSGRLDAPALLPALAPPLTPPLARALFLAFDENRDGHVDFKELACGISAACRGPSSERHKFLFKMFDRDRDGRLNGSEIHAMARALLTLTEGKADPDGVVTDVPEERVAAVVGEVLRVAGVAGEAGVSQEEFLLWGLSSELAATLLTIVYEVCHIVLGLPPRSPQDEGQVVAGWLARAEAGTRELGTFWYLVPRDWWLGWGRYTEETRGSVSASSTLQRGSKSAYSTLDRGSTSACSTLERGSTSACSTLERGSTSAYSSLERGSNSACSTMQRNSISSLSTLSLTDSLSVGAADGRSSDWATTGGLWATARADCGSSGNVSSGYVSSGNVSSGYPSRGSTAINPPASKTVSSDTASLHKSDKYVAGSAEEPQLLLYARSYSLANLPSDLPLGKHVDTSLLNVPSSSARLARRPPAIDNTLLIEPTSAKMKDMQLTHEGGRLRRGVVEGRDYVTLPHALWHVLHQWYGGVPALPRQVVHAEPPGELELELFPVMLRLHRHTAPSPAPPALLGGYGAVLAAVGAGVAKRQLSHTAAFTRLATMKQVYAMLASRLRLRTDDMRLWLMLGESLTLLEEGDATLCALGVLDRSDVLLEVRNRDLTWPEEMRALGGAGRGARARSGTSAAGVTGLHNLGNTCFLNAAIQCCSNTAILTSYFLRNLHLYELNPANPCGTRGHVAREYGALVRQLWHTGCGSVAPLKLRWTIGKWSGNFTGAEQHDSQELLAFLLDGLHEDLNRVHNKPYTELKDSEGRPDTLVAQEAWENHIVRNKSIIVDLFHGQLKSKVTCNVCGHQSARFDPFTYLSLQLPMESYTHVEVTVVPLDGSVPVRYGLRLLEESSHGAAKLRLSVLSGVPASRLLLLQMGAEAPLIRNVPSDRLRLRSPVAATLYAYELPPWADPLLARLESVAGVYPSSSLDPSLGVDLSSRLDPSSRIDNMQGNAHSDAELSDSSGGETKTFDSATNNSNGARNECDSVNGSSIEVLCSNGGLRGSNNQCNGIVSGPRPSHDSVSEFDCAASGPSNKELRGVYVESNGVNSKSSTVHANNCKSNEVSTGNGSISNDVESDIEIVSLDDEDTAASSRSVKDRQTLVNIQRSTASAVVFNTDESTETSKPPAPQRNGFASQRTSSNSTDTESCSSSPHNSLQHSTSSEGSYPIFSEHDLSKTHKGFVVAYHRKMIQQEVYFISSQQRRPSLFGLPLMVPCDAATSHDAVYRSVWTQVARLVTPLPPSDAANHATDCDDSLGYEFPFVLRIVDRSGLTCALCPWYEFCKGCQLSCDNCLFPAGTVAFLAIDWDPTALHLRYQTALERQVVSHPSVEEEYRKHTEPISLQHCLNAYTQLETLDYFCQHCKKMQPASKKLQIWRLPPILIVHLKRFQFVAERWIKSQKVVEFPETNFDPCDYLASVPRETLLLHRAQQEGEEAEGSLPLHEDDGPSSLPSCPPQESQTTTPAPSRPVTAGARRRNGSVLYGDSLQDFHQHRLTDDHDSLDVSYDLYAITCHSGVMESGHYVSYAKSAAGKWICFNDSSCKEVKSVDKESAYLLFYQRKGLDSNQYLPDVSDLTPPSLEQLDSETESEFKKQCSLM